MANKDNSNKQHRFRLPQAPWVKTGQFNCENGSWKGLPFDVDPPIAYAATALMAEHDGRATITRVIRRDNSAGRLVIHIELPV